MCALCRPHPCLPACLPVQVDLKDRWRTVMKHVEDGFSNVSAWGASTGLRDRQLQELARRAYERYKERTRQWPLG